MSQTILGQANSRRLSRSNSTTSSVVTVKKNDQQYLRPGNRNSYIARPATSDASATQLVAHENDRSDAQFSQTDNLSIASGMNIHRWSHSSTSTVPGIDAEPRRPMTNGSTTARNVRRDRSPNGAIIPKSQYSTAKQHDRARSGSSPKKPNSSRPVRRSSPAATSKTLYNNFDSQASSSGVPSSTQNIGQASSNDDEAFYRGAWEHRTGSNKFGQPVEAVTLQYTTGTSRQQRTENFGSQSSLQSASTHHISVQKRPSHRSYRDRSANGSKDTATGSSMSSIRSEQSRGRGHRSPTQKSMLSKALNKANVAVQLDNAQNVQGAIEAYIEACDLLQEVMVRNSDMDDHKKLSAIRATYSHRIAELHDLDDSFNHLMDKELPEYPASQDLEDPEDLYPDDPHFQMGSTEIQPGTIPPRQESLLPQIFGGESYVDQVPPTNLEKSPSTSNLRPPMDVQYMPSPLLPRRPPSPPQDEDVTPIATLQPPNAITRTLETQASSESTSWLDTLDESASSPNSSRISSFDFGPRDGQLVSEIEAEFDALNQAVESAYNDDTVPDTTPKPSDQGTVKAETPSLGSPIHDLVTVPHSQTLPQNISAKPFDFLSGEELDSEAEEEEELLEMMMADGYDLGISKNDNQTKSALPRQSDSSGISGRSSGRGHDSLATSTTTATSGTGLSTLSEKPEFGLPQISATQMQPKPVTSPKGLQSPPRQLTRPARSASVEKHVGLRDRRLSGQSAKQLKIETYNRRNSISKQQQPQQQAPSSLEIPHSAPPPDMGRTGSASNVSNLGLPLTPMASVSGESAPSESPATPALHGGDLPSTFDHSIPLPQSPGKLTRMMPPPRKNVSSSSLKPRNLSVTTTEINSETPTTPGSIGFPESRRTGSMSTPAVPTVSPNVLTSVATGGMYLFDHIASPTMTMSNAPRSPALGTDPLPLEPCPESFLLRPFWLMRCLYQVLAHPKGGYLTSKLFIPRDIWRVKNVKLKAIDDKIAQCDLLTAALLKLAKVDTLDADAVWEELQSFEMILDQTRQSLQKKLGNEVGLSGSATVFKNSPAGDDSEALPTKSSNKQGNKGFASSWRKLRSKSSTAALLPNHAPKDAPSGLTMPSLPMTDSSNVATSRSYRNQRHPPPTPTAIPYIPAQHATYMASLARLFDSVQVLDAIARQVEDPGLKATSQTQVGLEFSIRNAAEFFAFYVLRFALADIGLLVDKFLKRGTEWVMT